MVFDEPTLRKLRSLTLVASQVRAGLLQGDRRARKRGSSLEFADYRNYVPGDDLRRLDWNVYARLEKPFIKLFEDEEDLSVNVLLDASQSMNWGDGETHKFTWARKVSAALGSIALSRGDRFTLHLLTPGRKPPQYGPARGSQHLFRLLAFLENYPPAGITALEASLREFALVHPRPGLTFLLTDLLDPAGYQPALKHLRSRGHEVAILHLLAPDELDPALAGDLKLIDSETGQPQEVSLDGGMRRLYRERVQAWRGEIQAHCRQRNIHYLGYSTATPWEKVVLHEMRREGLVK